MTTTSIVIDRPADDVFAYVTDPTQFHQWQHGVVSGGMKETGTPTVGSLCTMTRRIGGANRPSTSVVTKMNPPTSWAVHGIDGPIRALVDVAVQALDDARSRVSIEVDFDAQGIGKLLARLSSGAKQPRRCPQTSPGSRTGWSRPPPRGCL